MKWPWHTTRTGADRLAIRDDEHGLAWVQTAPDGQLRRAGLELRGNDSPADFARRVRALDLPGRDVLALLPLPAAQLLQIDAPAVKPEELKSAARWRIKDQVDTRLDELTVDVLNVGDGRSRPTGRQLFVVAARNAQIQAVTRDAQAAGLQLSVIDIAELAQRNLQHAAARTEGLGDRATAALMRHGDQALLTICAGGELFYARRLDWDDTDLQPAATGLAALPAALEELDFVDYGAADATPDTAGAPRLVVEVQRSMDLWERSWPDLPLAGLWVKAGELSPALLAALAPAMGFPVHPLVPERLFPGFDAAVGDAALRPTVLQLLGALQRHAA